MFRGFAGILAILILTAGWSYTNRLSAQSGQDQETLVHYSLYYEDYKNEDYESALPNLRWILENAPTAPRKNDINFERAVVIYKEIGLSKEDPDERRNYLDSAIVFLDTAVDTLQALGASVDEYEWIVKKGQFLQENAEYLPDLQNQVGPLYEEAFMMKPDETDPYYMNYVIGHYVQDNDKEGAIAFMEKVEEERGDDRAIVEILDKWRNALFTGPEERYEFLLTQYDKSPDDTELISELFDLALEVEDREMLYELSGQLMEMEPSARTFRLVAKMKIEDGEAAEAYQLLQEAMTLPDAGSSSAEMYYNMGIAQQQMGRLSKARTHFRQALQANPEFGEAYVAIGDLYVEAISNCGSFEREDRAVYWLVTDYYNRALRVKPELGSSVRQKINSYRGVYPDQEMLFFKNWNVGDRYMVDYGCYSWINEATTVKVP